VPGQEAPERRREPAPASEPAAAGEPVTAREPAAAGEPVTAREPAAAGELVAAAIAGDQSAFAALTQRYRRELHVHCYRMLASFDDAEDAVQETFLRAWRGRDGFGGSTMFRAWLYRIATNVCLDLLRRRAHRASVLRSFAEVPWLQPYPDRLLDEAAAPGEQPDAAVIERETIELAFVAALQVLPPRQRAALIARDVLGWPASQTAALLEMSVAAANSALQRARATMREHLPARRSDWSGRSAGQLSDTERDLLGQFIDAHQRCDAAAAVAIAAQDIRVTMPPYPVCYDGVGAIGPLLERALGPDRDGDWQLVPTAANRMPAAASYLRRPGDSEFRAFKLDVLRTRGRVIAEITTFGASLFPAFGLPSTLGPGTP
jgi:RNA polymerase sigma-70 factor (TIGR02960 family)